MIHDKISKYGQVTLILALISVFAMLLLPLSSGALDALLMMNIIGTLTVLVLSVTVHESLKLYSFPTLLLICTLYRLGLNLSSTRLILSEGQAGKIIETFGQTLTSGNLFVGLITFLVLQVIQFLVISKGAERVSEVSARFTLDALPGKQMSIDADLRAGLISNEAAQLKRKELLQESKFFGSMDGAMKFVKGETMAGFLITGINILGGFLIGMLQKDMSFDQALKVYTFLTIGDGLAAQIPAFLLSISAGVLVTRVNNPKGNSSLGSELGQQVFEDPQKLYLVGGGVLAMGLIPGFPTLLFLLGAAGIAGFATLLIVLKRQEARKQLAVATHKIEKENELGLGQALPLVLELSPDMYQKFTQDDRWQICLNTLFPRLKAMLSRKMGVPLPDLKIAVNEFLSPERYAIQIFEVTVDEGFLSPEHCVIRNYKAGIKENLEENESTSETVHGTPIALLKLEKQKSLANQGLKAIAPEEMLLKHLGKVLKRHAHEFVGIQEVREILTHVEKTHGELVKEVMPRMLSINKLTEVLKRLVEENVSIKDFRLILETLSGVQPDSKDAATLSEIIRNAMKRALTAQHLDQNKVLNAITIDDTLEKEISEHIHQDGTESYLYLDPERISIIQQLVQGFFKEHQLAETDVILLVAPEIRRFVRKIIESSCPDVAVLSYSEAATGTTLNTLGSVSEASQGLRLVGESL